MCNLTDAPRHIELGRRRHNHPLVVENHLAMRRITAHELVLHHYFCIIKKHYRQKN